LKIDRPTKGCIVTSCDSIDGPIVKLRDGSVRRLKDYEESKKLYKEIEEIIYLGDILFPLGDVIDRNSDLLRPGYVGEWWELELQEKGGVFSGEIDFDLAVKLSKDFGVSLHPDFIFYWTEISVGDFSELVRWLNNGIWRGGKLVLPWGKLIRGDFSAGKRALEILGVEHLVVLDNVVIDGDVRGFLANLGVRDMYNNERLDIKVFGRGDSVLGIVNELSEFEIRDKAGSFIGARMGRPEKAKLRKLTGSPNVLFPVGDQGGRLNSIQDAVDFGFVKSDFPVYRCECGNEGIGEICEACGKKAVRCFYCRDCGEVKSGICKLHNRSFDYMNRRVDVGGVFRGAVSRLEFGDYEVPPLVKGIRKSVGKSRVPENLAKGILRAKFNLSVNKDGTVRYDGTEIPLTHFKPVEIGTSVERLRELGYVRDIDGRELVDGSQILELAPHDVVLSSCPKGKDEKADDVFFNIANFVDEELARFYKMERYYNLESKGDLIGQLVVCMAPHNCAGVVGRIIGFSEMQGLVASPYMHAAMRRDCDGDEAAVMLLMDVLLNFSREFLPGHRGGKQDAPLVLNARIRAGEVDDQILFFETCDKYPLEFYTLAESGAHSSEVSGVELVKERLKSGVDVFRGAGFTHDTGNFNSGNTHGAYKALPTMKEKVDAQMELVGKIRAVDEDDVARLVLERHFIRDIRGNLRKFGRQEFRCSGCNKKFRRPPLVGVCDKCKGKLIFTVSEGSVKKYLGPARELVEGYNIPAYTREVFELTEDYVESVFGKGEEQKTL